MIEKPRIQIIKTEIKEKSGENRSDLTLHISDGVHFAKTTMSSKLLPKPLRNPNKYPTGILTSYEIKQNFITTNASLR